MRAPREISEMATTASNPISAVNDNVVVDVDDFTLLGHFASHIVGIQYYKGIISRREFVSLKRQPTNAYDTNAIAVHNAMGVMIGHLPRDVAAAIAGLIDTKCIEVDVRTGSDVAAKYKVRVDVWLYAAPSRHAALTLHLRSRALLLDSVPSPSEKGPGCSSNPLVFSAVWKAMLADLATGFHPGARAAPSMSIGEEAERTAPCFQGKLLPFQAFALGWMRRRELSDVKAPVEDAPSASPVKVPKPRAASRSKAASAASTSSATPAATTANPPADPPAGGLRKRLRSSALAADDGVYGGVTEETAAAAAAVPYLWKRARDPKTGRVTITDVVSHHTGTDNPTLTRGGILADAGGLGKTAVVLALIADDILLRGGATSATASARRTLIVVPPAQLVHWRKHAVKFFGAASVELASVLNRTTATASPPTTAAGKPAIVILDASVPAKLVHVIATVNQATLVIASNATLRAEDAARQRGTMGRGSFAAAPATGNAEFIFGRTDAPVRWHRVVLDDALNSIKTYNSLVSRAARKIDASIRWCMCAGDQLLPDHAATELTAGGAAAGVGATSGIPVSNRLFGYLGSLISFLRLAPFDEARLLYDSSIGIPLAQTLDVSALMKLRALLSMYMLRRTRLLTSTDASVSPDSAAGGTLVVTLPPRRSRTTWLTMTPSEQSEYDQLKQQIRATVMSSASSLGVALPGSLMNERVISSQALSFLRMLCDHPLLLPEDTSAAIASLGTSSGAVANGAAFEALRRDLEARAQNEADSAATAGSSDGAATDREGAAAMRLTECVVCLDQLRNPVLTACRHVFCAECVDLVISSTSSAPCPLCRKPLQVVLRWADILRHDAERLRKAKVDAGGAAVAATSTKLDAVLRLCRDPFVGFSDAAVGPSPPQLAAVRIVVVSQWLPMLTLIQSHLAAQRSSAACASIALLHSGMSAADRASQVDTFASFPAASADPPVLLASPSALLGLDVTCASIVIFVDVSTSAKADEQVVSAVHRIGQPLPVFVHRLVLQHTVEASLLAVQKSADKLAGAASSTGRSRRTGRAEAEDATVSSLLSQAQVQAILL